MKIILNILKGICFLLLIGLVSLLIISVVMRYVFNNPLDSIEEAGILLLVWLTFLGATLAASEKKHMGMDLLLNKLRPKLNKALVTFISIITIVAFIFVFYYGIKISIRNINLVSESMRISFAWFYIPIPLASLIYIFVEINKLSNVWYRKKEVKR